MQYPHIGGWKHHVFVLIFQREIDFLKVNIHEARQTVRERKAQLENEERTQRQLRREIEVNAVRIIQW